MQVAVAAVERAQVLTGSGLALSGQAWKPGQEPQGLPADEVQGQARRQVEPSAEHTYC